MGSSRRDLLDIVATEVVICTKCLLSKTRENAVPGEGNPASPIMFVGEAPGSSEDTRGRPFVGVAGRFLESLFAEIGYSREEFFICNVLKCRPPSNRPPRRDEIRTCTPYLDRQISIIQPKFVVTLGKCATMYIFSKANLSFSGITQSRGRFRRGIIDGKQVTIFATFHPAAALYSPKYKKQIIDDFRLLCPHTQMGSGLLFLKA